MISKKKNDANNNNNNIQKKKNDANNNNNNIQKKKNDANNNIKISKQNKPDKRQDRLKKNAESARKCRWKRKETLKTMETTIQKLQEENRTLKLELGQIMFTHFFENMP